MSLERQEDNNASNLTLRSPLGIAPSILEEQAKKHQNNAIADGSGRRRRSQKGDDDNDRYFENHDETVLPILCALSVASHVLELSVETQFTAACLVHRYAVLVRVPPPQPRSSLSSSPLRDNKTNSNKRKRQEYRETNDNDSELVQGRENVGISIDWKWVLPACIFIACKVEEQPRRIRDVVNCLRMIDWRYQPQPHQLPPESSSTNAGLNDTQEETVPDPNKTPKLSIEDKDEVVAAQVQEKSSAGSAGSPGSISTGRKGDIQTTTTTTTMTATTFGAVVVVLWNPTPPKLDDAYWKDKETIIKMEQVVLRYLQFDCFVSHPHRAIVSLIDRLFRQYDVRKLGAAESSISSRSSTTTAIEAFFNILVLNAWKKLNDAIFSIHALQVDVMTLACAAIDIVLEEQTRQLLQRDAVPASTATNASDPSNTTDDHLRSQMLRQIGILARAETTSNKIEGIASSDSGRTWLDDLQTGVKHDALKSAKECLQSIPSRFRTRSNT